MGNEAPLEVTPSPAALKPTDFELYRRYKLDQLDGTVSPNVATATLANSGRASPMSMASSSRLSSMAVVAKRYSPKLMSPQEYL